MNQNKSKQQSLDFPLENDTDPRSGNFESSPNVKALPEGWKWVKLGEVLKVRSGNGLTSKNMLESGFPVYGGNGISGYYSDFMFENPVLILGRVGAKCGVVHFTKPKSWVTDNALIVDSNPNLIDRKYLFWLLYRMDLNQYSVSTAQPVISGTKIYPLEAPLPPLSIQAQIVEKLEALLSELDKGKAQLLTAQAQLKTYRQAVLKYAFEGKLTGDTEGWQWVKLGDIADVGTGVTPLRTNKSFWENGTIPWITSGALNDDNVTKSKEFITQTALKETSLKIYPKHTLLIALYGEGKTRGKCSELLFESTTNQAIAGIKLKNEFSESRKFLKLFLLKKYQDLRILASGGVQPNLNLSLIKNTELPFPPLSTQQKIVTEIESRLSVCDKLEETLKVSLAQCETLRQSLLKRAFEGRLV